MSPGLAQDHKGRAGGQAGLEGYPGGGGGRSSGGNCTVPLQILGQTPSLIPSVLTS